MPGVPNELDPDQAYGDSTGLTSKDAGVEECIHGGDATRDVDPEVLREKKRDELTKQLEELDKATPPRPLYDPQTGEKINYPDTARLAREGIGPVRPTYDPQTGERTDSGRDEVVIDDTGTKEYVK
jgi:hypothetical protein